MNLFFLFSFFLPFLPLATVANRISLSLTDLDPGSRFGEDIIISKNGLYAVVGASGQFVGESRLGVAYVLARSSTRSSDWDVHHTLFDFNVFGARDDILFGFSVSISNDGAVIAIGIPRATAAFFSTGAVQIYTKIDEKTNSYWDWELTATLWPQSEVYDSMFGSSVRLSGGGTRLLVGAPAHALPSDATADGFEGIHGAVYSFSYLSKNDSQIWQEDTIIFPPIEEVGRSFGAGLCLSSDGQTAVARSAGNSLSGSAGLLHGTAFVYTFDTLQSEWKLHSELNAFNYSSSSSSSLPIEGAKVLDFGAVCAFSEDAETLVLSARISDILISARSDLKERTVTYSAFVFELIDERWRASTLLTGSPVPVPARLPALDTEPVINNLDISSDGLVISIGSYRSNDNAGVVKTFQRRARGGLDWEEAAQFTLASSRESAEAEFGFSVTLDQSGDNLLISAPRYSDVSEGVISGGLFTFCSTDPSLSCCLCIDEEEGEKEEGESEGIESTVMINESQSIYNENEGESLMIVIAIVSSLALLFLLLFLFLFCYFFRRTKSNETKKNSRNRSRSTASGRSRNRSRRETRESTLPPSSPMNRRNSYSQLHLRERDSIEMKAVKNETNESPSSSYFTPPPPAILPSASSSYSAPPPPSYSSTENGQFQCSICQNVYSNEQDLSIHKSKRH